MNYGDAEHQQELEKEYTSLLDDETSRQKEWVKLRKRLYKKDGEFKALLPTKLKKMMILPYTQLAEIYEKYLALGLSKKDQLHIDIKALFSYDDGRNSNGIKFKKLSSGIIDFFKNENNFTIHTCHYCEMTYINYFTLRNGKRTQFDLDHVLDKGKCPLVALSLYNLVPACPTCNGPHIKGMRTISISLEQRKKISPSSTLYDFENQVKIWIRPKTRNVHNTNFLKNKDDYELDFDTSSDTDYDKEIELLFLKERYNYHKCEALRLADLKTKYTPSKIKEMAKIICSIKHGVRTEMTLAAHLMIEQIRTDIFGSEYSNRFHRAFGKLHKDILGF